MCPKNNINNNMVQVIPSPIEHMPIFEQLILCLNEQNVQMNNEQGQETSAVSDDQQFLERVVAGTEDMSSADFGDKLIAIAENLDPALEALFEQATDAYANYVISLEV